ncbi:MAG: four helix bundle protein [Bacillota bacterium]
MKTYNDYEQLAVWQKAHDLVLRIYNYTNTFPKHEKLGLTGQIRRAAASIPTNIAEGTGTKTPMHFCKYLYDARASLMETRYLLRLSRDLGYINEQVYNELVRGYNEVGKILNGLINSLGTQ